MKLWTATRIAKALKASDTTIRRAIRASGIEVLTVNRTLKIKDSVLIDWLGFDPWRDKVWTIGEVAGHAGVSKRTIERTLEKGDLGSVTIGARLKRIRHSQLIAWMGGDPTYDPRPRSRRAPDPDETRLFEM